MTLGQYIAWTKPIVTVPLHIFALSLLGREVKRHQQRAWGLLRRGRPLLIWAIF